MLNAVEDSQCPIVFIGNQTCNKQFEIWSVAFDICDIRGKRIYIHVTATPAIGEMYSTARVLKCIFME